MTAQTTEAVAIIVKKLAARHELCGQELPIPPEMTKEDAVLLAERIRVHETTLCPRRLKTEEDPLEAK